MFYGENIGEKLANGGASLLKKSRANKNAQENGAGPKPV
jgi:hypothetical protein